MGLFTHDIRSMDDLFMHGLRDIYYAETQIVKALPTMIEKARSPLLDKALREHLRETETQVVRLENAFELLGTSPSAETCPAMDGLIEEANDIAGEVEDQKVLDAAVIGSAQAVEHYEIARYGTLLAWADQLGHQDIIPLLEANLAEEKAADMKLSDLAEGIINPEAASSTHAA